MAGRAAADLAADTAAHAGLMNELRRQQQEAISAAAPHAGNCKKGGELTANDAANLGKQPEL
eukprot:gene341-15244_t